MIYDDAILRVKVFDNDTIRIEKIGMGPDIAGLLLPTYIKTSELPKWLQRRLAVLAVMPFTPPTSVVEGIGRRIEGDVFWISYTGDETDGDDTGEES